MRPDFVVHIGTILITGGHTAHLTQVLLQLGLTHMQCGCPGIGKDVAKAAIGCLGIGDDSKIKAGNKPITGRINSGERPKI